MSESKFTYRGYPVVVHPSGIVGIFVSDEPNPISTAPNVSEAKQIIDAWLDAP